jgi:sugar phosphate isomerase/epimerase
MTDQPKYPSINWGFSTLGCGELTLEEISALAEKYRISNFEIRTIGKRIDISKYFSEIKLTSENVANLLGPKNQKISCLDSSFRLIDTKPNDRDELLQYSRWAHTLNVPYVRVFPRGGGHEGAPLTEKDYLQAAENVRWWREEKKKNGWRLNLILETHDAICRAEKCLKLQSLLDEPIDVLWDSHNTWALGEPIQTTWDALHKYIRGVHFKDSVIKPGSKEGHSRDYVFAGTGDMPSDELFSILVKNKFSGPVSLEWERWWHPELVPLTEALENLSRKNWW